MAEPGLSNEDFMDMLMEVSRWYEQHNCLNMLKVLYRDHVPLFNLDKASNTRDLLGLLLVAQDLSPTNLTILYDTIKATKQFALEQRIKEKIPLFPNTREIEISEFSDYRQNLLKFGLELNMNDVEDISGVVHVTAKKYADSWDMIMDLEQLLIIREETIGEFTKKFRKSKLHRASDALRRMDLYTPTPMMITLIIFVTGSIVGITFVIAINPEPYIHPCIDDVVREYFTDRQKDLYENVTIMTPPTWNNEHKIDITKVFTDLDLLISKRGDESDYLASKRRKAKPTTLAEVLSVVKSTDSCKVLITGERGMGKSTILRMIAHNWAINSNDTFAGKLLFLINIRDINEGENFLDAIMQEINTPVENGKTTLSKDSIERFLKIHADEIVLLLDGFDELQAGTKNPFEDYDLTKYTVIATSRPENTIDVVERCDVHVQVEGFNLSNIKNYIFKHFNFVNEIELGESLIQEFGLDSNPLLRRSRWDHKEAFKLCRSPYLLVEICTMWRKGQHIPKDLSELYKGLFCNILNQYIRRRDEKMNPVSEFDRIPKKYESAILTLGESVYRNLLKNKQYIERYDMELVENDKTIVDLALNIGFVYKKNAKAEYDLKEKYTTHKLLLEALAGFYISIESQETRLNDDEYETIRSNEYIHTAKILAIGFMGPNAGKLLKHWLIIRASNYYSLAEHFDYIKPEHQRRVLQVLNENMSTEMKEHVEDMANSFRVYFGNYTVYKDGHLIQLIRNFLESKHQFSVKVSTIIESSGQPSDIICRMIAHISLILQVIPGHFNDKYLLQIVQKWGVEAIAIISTEWEKHNLNDEVNNLIFSNFDSRDIDVAQMWKILEIAPKLNELYIDNCRLSGTNVNTLFKKCLNSTVLFELRRLDIRHNYLDDINGTLLGNLLKTNQLKKLDMQHCNLNGNIVGDIIKQFDRMDKHYSFGLKGNDLSNIDGELLVKLVNVLTGNEDYSGSIGSIKWSDYNLLADNLQDIVESCDENCRFRWKSVDLSNVNLSSINETTLANLFKIFPHLTRLYMDYCNLTGNIVGDMLNECDRMGVVFNNFKLRLTGNDLSNINGKSLVKLVNVLDYSRSIKWSDYHLSPDNLRDLVNACADNCSFKFHVVDLNDINLSSISGNTLANLFTFFPHLINLDMFDCNLTGSIVDDMLNECEMMGILLKEKRIDLTNNGLSNHYHDILATIII